MAGTPRLTRYWPRRGDRTEPGLPLFRLDEETDALYDAAGAATRRDAKGNSGREVRHELDATVRLTIEPHSHLLLGYSHLRDGDFLLRTGGVETTDDPDLFYIQYGFKF